MHGLKVKNEMKDGRRKCQKGHSRLQMFTRLHKRQVKLYF